MCNACVPMCIYIVHMYRHKHQLKKIAPVYHTHTHLHIDVYEEAIVTFK